MPPNATSSSLSAMSSWSGTPAFQAGSERQSFGNAAIAMNWRVIDTHLCDFALVDRLHARTLTLSTPFALTLADGRVLDMRDLTLLASPGEETLEANPSASCLAGQIAGKRIVATLTDDEARFLVRWSVEQRDGSSYLRERVSITALKRDEPVVNVAMLGIDGVEARHATEAGKGLDGVPVIVGDVYLGIELPRAQNRARNGTVTLTVARALPLGKGKTVEYSAVAGVARSGQMRRDFAAYVERERAHPYRPFLHYNSWYDIGYLTPYTAKQAVERIETVGRELHARRDVHIDSFMFDDGWDDLSGSWHFSRDFPQGFVPLREAAARFGAASGVWLSPWGGYCEPRDARVARGAASGYEVVDRGFALSGPNYYARFHEVVMTLLGTHGVNHFKFDGTGNADHVVPGSRFDSDWDAAIHLIEDIRAAKPETFINLSTGTHPSPFWLRFADTIWRDGADHGFAGTGCDRERWITYRDAQTYRNVVVRSPLFPLNSLMLHGIICAQHCKGLDAPQGEAFAHEVRSFFAGGTQLQELYVTPSLLAERDWDVLAQAAQWARGNADVLRDTHWIGGAPDALDVYGWAAWSPQRAIVTLRNPDQRMQRFVLDLREALALPDGAATHFEVHEPPWGGAHIRSMPGKVEADQPLAFELEPFEVHTVEFVVP